MHRLVVAAVCLLPATSTLRADPPKAVADFTLKSIAGGEWTLAKQKSKAIVVAFIGTQCPINNAYMPRLVELEKAYADKGVQFVAINSNEHDTLETIRTHAKKHGLSFPILRDEKHLVANRFGAERHPTVFLLDDKHFVCYQGRIDDQFGIGYQRKEPTRRDLVAAIDELLAGKSVSVARTKVEGCFITRVPAAKKKADVTYARDVSRILQNRCQECHRPGQIGPMPLLTYDDASAWSLMIREVVSEERMPPWHADPKHGSFKNDRRLSAAERAKLIAWIDAGCPEGDAKDLPRAKKFAPGWTIGQPDAVFTFKDAIAVPAKATRSSIPYKYVVVKTNFDEDKWIHAVEARPGNHAVVHHIIVYIVAGGKRARTPGDGIGSGMLVAYAPGDLGSVFPANAAKKLPKGALLAFQMHYTPTGTAQTDKSSIGFIFAKTPPQAEMRTRAIAQQAFLIPPGAANHKVTSKTTFSKDAVLYSMFPHMHLRGKDFQFDVVYPDGKRQTLLSVPRYDFGWQSNYILAKPLLLPAGTRIECTAHFDNSAKNPNNPNSKTLVFWGEQTWHEMMIGFVDYAYTSEKR
ncbi:MAG: redoxin domain-containing protein [Planctomycetes bacterium]|nr:redoxin domain-containing protein [Planctomycetota bacterium]